MGPLLCAFALTFARKRVQGEDVQERVQGGLLNDGIASFVAALGTSMPNTTFSQNNGVISLTRCASRQAGLAAAGMQNNTVLS